MDHPFVTATRGEMCYCPGCSHGLVLERLGAALERLGLPPEQVCIVSDIGCIGTADRYFACHTFHGLHGRSITYAEGMKRARPELTVIVLIGDGGCGIGTAHLVHAARRQADIKIIVCNNFNFGMTGGQHSPTTPDGCFTATTPCGAIEHPFDVCRTVMAGGAAYVARCSAHDDQLDVYLDGVLRCSGLALLDCWELCVAYFVPANKLTPPKLTELSKRLDMPFGVLQDLPPRRLTEGAGGADIFPGPNDRKPQLPATPPGHAASALQAEHRLEASATSSPSVSSPRLDWPSRAEICVAGSAGQRIRSAVGVIGELAVAGGLYATQQDDFPITVRKGHSISRLIVSREPILYCGVDEPELLIVLSADGLQRIGAVDELDRGCLLIADEGLSIGATPANLRRVSVKQLERSAGRASAALATLCLGLVERGWTSPESLRSAAEGFLTGAYREENLRAIEAGLRLRIASSWGAGVDLSVRT